MRRAVYGAVVVWNLLLSFGAGAQTISDGDFSSGWSSFLLTVTTPLPASDPSAMFVSTVIGSGGNPGGYLDTVQGYAGPNMGIHVAHMDANGTIDPAALGGLDGLTFSFDVNFFDYPGSPPAPSFAVGYRPLVEQGGVFFAGPTVVAVSPSWMSFVEPTAAASDFVSFNGTSAPDFSASGGLITVGFETWNGTGGPVWTSTHSGLDNFSVIVAPVPEPSGLIVLAGVAMLLTLRRWVFTG